MDYNRKPLLNYRVDLETLDWLEKYAAKTKKSKSDVMREALILFRLVRDSEQSNLN